MLAFALLVSLRLHGFSLAAWHGVIDGSAPAEVLLGEPRPIRSDDWKVHLPLLFAQDAAQPRMPVVNPAIGAGLDMRLPIETPIAHWLVLFRPSMWGFSLSPDVGMAWMWWARALGLFATWLAVMAVVARGRLGLAAAGSALLLVSPFFQFWALNAAPFAVCAGAVFLAAVALARARGPRAIAGAALALGLAGAWFALTLYPPYQVTLAWLVVALVAGFLLDARDELPLRSHVAWRAGGLAAAGVLALAVLAAFLWDAREPLSVLRNTVYPGRRLSLGGDRNVAELMNANLGAPLWAESWGPLFNVCEAASFWMLSPVLIARLVWRGLRGERLDPVSAAVALYAGALWVYAVLGFPEWLARATGLGLAPGRRAVIGLGVADAILLVRFAATAPREEWGRTLLLAAAWLAALAAGAAWLLRELPGARAAWLAAFALANAGLAIALLRAPRLALPALAAATAATTLWFNPLAAGGAGWLRENELSRKILEIDRAEGGRSVWISFGRDDLPNLFRALGVASLNGVHPLPQLALWERIDPDRRQRNVYDRYAHVAVVAAPGPPRFQLHSQDYVILRIDPRGPALRALGATHVLVRDEDARAFEKLAGFEELAVVGPNHLYRVPRDRAP